MSRKKRRHYVMHDSYNQMALEDGASEVIYGEVPYLQPLNQDHNSDLLFALPGEDSGALESQRNDSSEYNEPKT